LNPQKYGGLGTSWAFGATKKGRWNQKTSHLMEWYCRGMLVQASLVVTNVFNFAAMICVVWHSWWPRPGWRVRQVTRLT